ncbi:zona pellucida-like domain-containing protein 1 [Takifugu flavidus]|uniref:Zona pellucida-like domain-containing protein 1 n=1 Tax=Takifugu flavidus TaxID=433684 RepID=A0A5C6PG62_9TELE|nr:zona pellucida-like domain-containing protein 1 [Takifugu flavidus]XP_056906695.1 zona pellucida-like domain-containing protein 1 [Takifugu flavidus]TWW77240.1 Zona pellucida-like domain-containing protein 1 [Takifugu flavidus]
MDLYLCLPLLVILLQPAQCVYNCSSEYDRIPDNSDLTVDCGTTVITLEVNLCSAKWAGFNASNLALNSNHNISDCLGSVDISVDPPVIRYQLPVNHSQDNSCRQSLQIVDEAPDPAGPFSSFLTIQSVIITGYIDTPRSDQGIISYSTDLHYHFSCRYPLEYLINNTQIVASSVSVATSDSNGTFIDTLKMAVFNDTNYSYQLVVPSSGLELRSRVYVEVKAVNLTGNFYILLDHCFATPTAYNMSQTEQHNFFTGCSVEQRTSVTSNGLSTVARFDFEAFRFVQHRDQPKSSIYVHCILRLCEPNKCQELLSACGNRRRRALTPFGRQSTDSATLSLGPLYMANEEKPLAAPYSEDVASEDEVNVTGVAVGVVFGSAAAVLLVLGGWFVLKKFYWAGGIPRAFN